MGDNAGNDADDDMCDNMINAVYGIPWPAGQTQQQSITVNPTESDLQHLETIYETNVPIFRRENLEKVAEQLERCEADTSGYGYVATLPDINGQNHRVFVSAYPPYNDYIEPERLVPEGSKYATVYYPLQHLTNPERRLKGPEHAFMSLHLGPVFRFSEFAESQVRGIDQQHANSKEEVCRVKSEIEREWKASTHYQELQKALHAARPQFALDKIISIALGPLTINNVVAPRSVIQHAMLLDISSILLPRRTRSEPSAIYVQDPGYSQQDEEILASMGFIVLKDPRAFLMLDESSILVALYPGIPVKQIVADICHPGRPPGKPPGVIIWDKYEHSDDSNPNDWYWYDPDSDVEGAGMADPQSTRTIAFIEDYYDRWSFPYHECIGGKTRSNNAVIYVRKADEETASKKRQSDSPDDGGVSKKSLLK